VAVSGAEVGLFAGKFLKPNKNGKLTVSFHCISFIC
jgi:hypothetical protein